MKILLVTPPLTQLNTPYPATAYLAGYLTHKGFNVQQLDLGIELVDQLFTKAKLSELFDAVEENADKSFVDAKILAQRARYEQTVDSVISFLRGNDLSLANRIVKRGYLPEGDRFKGAVDLEYAFGEMGYVDMAKHLATLYIEDISDFIRRNITPHFELIRYAESLCVSLPSFDDLHQQLQGESNLIDSLMLDIMADSFQAVEPQLIGFSVPFPGNLYGALKCSQWLKASHPEVAIAMGGGYVSTELRQMSDIRLFEYVDYLIFDDGENAVEQLALFLDGKADASTLVRTSYLQDGAIADATNHQQNIKGEDRVAPLFSQLPLSKYVNLIETANPMLKLWSDGRWNKLILAHGCYWAKCAFCDVNLDYIARFEPYDAVAIVDMMENVMAQTGQSGFHFVDEAAPPVMLKKLSLEIIKRQLNVTWWANIRFEKRFTRDLALLMARAGCIAVSGGLEVASDRILKLINKGIDIKQTSAVTRAFSDAGIMVHAYLMYGFPSESTQETIDSLEVVRQLFEQGLIQSAFWHRFAMTVHSPAGTTPEKYGAKRLSAKINTFANNETFFKDSSDTNLPMLGEGLRKATYNYMHQLGFDKPVQSWFDSRVPRSTISSTLVQGYLVTPKHEVLAERGSYVWIADGFQLLLTDSRRPKLHIFSKGKVVEVILRAEEILFWEDFFRLLEENGGLLDVEAIKSTAEHHLLGAEGALLASKVWKTLRKNGLIQV